jgi:NADH-quinone oxidoreductase subunit J
MNTLVFTFHFYLFGLIAIASALLFVTRKSPIAAVLWLVNTMFCLSALFIMLDAQFIGVVQVLIYAGAIMVVFLFVVMLLNLGEASDVSDIRSRKGRLAAGLFALALLAEMFALSRFHFPALAPITPESQVNVITPIARPLFHEFLLPFEVTSIVLLVAVIGAVVLAKRGPGPT